MLTSDLVRARVKEDRLVLSPLSGKLRQRAVELAEQLLAATDLSLGASRESWETNLKAVTCLARERILRDGLIKLIEDGIEFESPTELDPVSVRRRLFEAASAGRGGLEPGVPFDRDAILGAVAQTCGVQPDVIEAAMFADLKSAQRLLNRAPGNAEMLVAAYGESQVQGVLLRAVRVRADVQCRDPGTYRRLFARLKFRRLLYRLYRNGAGYTLEVDGPYSLFESVTKYGLQLALAWTAFRECDVVDLDAEVRWGKSRRPLRFEIHHRLERADSTETAPSMHAPTGEAAELLNSVAARGGPWRGRQANTLLDLPGGGLCVPDVTFQHMPSGFEAHVELLGFWSRDAVWRRVEWARSGLGASVLFAVSERLRVSEQVLEGTEAAALYVYKGKPSAARLIEKLEHLRLAGIEA